ncbi:unnamed protein product [Heligmosomoides polygyrus]|uniref:Uncharacterized protein n=1 Tax=Heligmosomoides polygyrus TaxID=6339 RepID=A0A183G362_HELPZ|nr:unnamed protein product [Heligmosomoides polygyrus]
MTETGLLGVAHNGPAAGPTSLFQLICASCPQSTTTFHATAHAYFRYGYITYEPTFCGQLFLYERQNFSCSAELSPAQ